MNRDEIILEIQKAIAHPDNKYKTPYARTSDKKNFLHIWMIDAKKAAESVYKILKQTQP